MKLPAPGRFLSQPVILVARRSTNSRGPRPALPDRRGGTAVIVMLALLAIVLLYILANLRLLTRLDRELSLTERHQIRRLNALSVTHEASPVVVLVDTNAPGTNHAAFAQPPWR